jgi:GNAT superfamily N-acetyltransferase
VSTGNSLPRKRKNKIDLNKLIIKPLDPAMDRAAFTCGEEELDEFFKTHAAEHHEKHLARVYVALYENRIVGYYWLVAQSRALDTSPELSGKLERVAFAPCVCLGMLATHADLQGNGIGRALMMHAFGQTLAVAEHVGVYALTLEAIDQDKADTYERWGFQYFIEGDLWMYIPVATIRELLKPKK